MAVIPCKICGFPTIMTGTKLCDGCWSVESGLSTYLESEVGRKIIKNMIKEIEKK